MKWKVRILTVSDSVAGGLAEDRGGPAIESLLVASGFDVQDRRVVHDGIESVRDALVEMTEGFGGLVITTGGTGFSPRDNTPEGTRLVLDRSAPGLAEAMRLVSPLGRLTRGVAGTRAQSLVLNLPGSPQGAVESLQAVLDVIPHALDLLMGGQPHPSHAGIGDDGSGAT
ncbi:MAG: MogA/MoaB family molybdenum cofactor biosynthesis protein [Acidimicrobiales bacterium]